MACRSRPTCPAGPPAGCCPPPRGWPSTPGTPTWAAGTSTTPASPSCTWWRGPALAARAGARHAGRGPDDEPDARAAGAPGPRRPRALHHRPPPGRGAPHRVRPHRAGRGRCRRRRPSGCWARRSRTCRGCARSSPPWSRSCPPVAGRPRPELGCCTGAHRRRRPRRPPRARAELFRARVDRWLPDLLAGLTPLYPDPGAVADRLLLAAARAFAAREDELHALDLRRSLAPDWFQRPDVVGYAAYADRFAGDLAAVAARVPYLESLGVRYLHLMPLLAPGPPPNDGGYAVADYGAVRPDLGTMDDLEALTRELRGARDEPVPGPGAQPRRRHPRLGARRQGRGPGEAGLLPRLRRPHRARRLRGHAARGLPRPGAGQLHLGRRPGRLVWTTFNGYQWTSTSRTPTCCASTPRWCWTWPTAVSRCCGWTPSPSPGSGWAPTARTSPRCTRSPRRCARSPGSPAPRCCSRPRPSSARATSCPTSAPASTGARSATWPTTTASWCRSGRCWPAGTPCWPRTPCSSCRSRRRPPPGSPTCAATTTSAGRSTTATPRRWASAGTSTAGSCPTGTRGTSGSPGRRAWSSGRTRPPATGGSRGRRRRWPAWVLGPAGRARVLLAHALVLGFGGIRCCGPATSWACRTTPGGRRSPGTPTTTGGRTGRG